VDRGRPDSGVYLITGPMAAGKSTVGRLLAECFERGVYLEGDFFRRSIVSARAEMTTGAAPDALEQLRLRYRLTAATAGWCLKMWSRGHCSLKYGS
jgi:cytidylate kinase